MKMKKLHPCELIEKIENEEKYHKWNSYIPRLRLLSRKHPNVLVGLYIDGDDCCDGEPIAPITEDGNYDLSQSRPLSPDEREPFVFVPDR